MNIAFLDIETTGLDPLKHEILEVAIVLRHDDADEEVHFSLSIDEAKAAPAALDVNGYRERRAALRAVEIDPAAAKSALERTLHNALVVGNNAQFDLRFIEQFIGHAPWYYSPLDLKAFVAGRCGMKQPASTNTIADVSGQRLTKNAHTALADARWNRDVYDALTGSAY